MGELAASLVHEVSQPISGAITNAAACLLKLERTEPDVEGARVAVTRIQRDAKRAADVIRRIRSQFEKAALNREGLDLNEIIRETIALLRAEGGAIPRFDPDGFGSRSSPDHRRSRAVAAGYDESDP